MKQAIERATKRVPFPALETAGSTIARVSLGAYFLFAGVAKAQGELNSGFGTFAKSEAFAALQPSWLSDLFAAPYGYALPWAEIVVGATLALGFATRFSAFIVFMMLASFTIALMSALGISGGSPGPFHSNVILAAVALYAVGAGGGKLSVDALLQRCTEPRPDPVNARSTAAA